MRFPPGPGVTGGSKGLQGCGDLVEENRADRRRGATAAVVAKIQEDPRAAAAMKVTMQKAQKRAQKQAQGDGWRPNAPDLEGEAATSKKGDGGA